MAPAGAVDRCCRINFRITLIVLFVYPSTAGVVGVCMLCVGVVVFFLATPGRAGGGGVVLPVGNLACVGPHDIRVTQG